MIEIPFINFSKACLGGIAKVIKAYCLIRNLRAKNFFIGVRTSKHKYIRRNGGEIEVRRRGSSAGNAFALSGHLFLSLPTPTMIKKISDANVTIVAPDARSA